MKQNKIPIFTEIFYKNLAILLETIDNIFQTCKEYKISRQNYYNIKNKKNEISLKTFFKLAKMLKISPDKLLEICLLKNKSNQEIKDIYLANSSKIEYIFNYHKLKNIFLIKE